MAKEQAKDQKDSKDQAHEQKEAKESKDSREAKRDLKARKQKWFQIVAPAAFFQSTALGETVVAEPSALLGKTVKANLGFLSNDPKKQNVELTFRIVSVDGEKFLTQVTRYDLLPSSIKRSIRRGRARVDDSFIAYTSDGVRVRIKPLLITKTLTKHKVLTLLRKATRSFVRKHVKTITFEQLFEQVIVGNFRNQLKDAVNPIYPLKQVDFKVVVEEKKKLKSEEQKEHEAEERESSAAQKKQEEELDADVEEEAGSPHDSEDFEVEEQEQTEEVQA
ncbi:hypothetical protein HZB02_04380 [Candidatus Woesearchaeota archaeon]|nr:hypothetical protein [Candidatus Woesearchaeota archaeon]